MKYLVFTEEQRKYYHDQNITDAMEALKLEFKRQFHREITQTELDSADFFRVPVGYMIVFQENAI